MHTDTKMIQHTFMISLPKYGPRRVEKVRSVKDLKINYSFSFNLI